MTLYLIAFNDEWVPDLTTEVVGERGAVAVGWPQEVHRFPTSVPDTTRVVTGEVSS